MICPYYKNKEVFDGFNEIVEALGGKPLTEAEFRSSELRNLRTGVDYSAMEATYRMYHRNNGNMPDLAPNGKHSILFDTLLEYFNGDRAKAIKAKSDVYSDEFFNWFGDWINDSDNASKVVDENGEPLVVWHGTRERFSEFDPNKIHAGGGFWFTETRGEYGNIQIPAFLNMRKPYSGYALFNSKYGENAYDEIEHYIKLKDSFDTLVRDWDRAAEYVVPNEPRPEAPKKPNYPQEAFYEVYHNIYSNEQFETGTLSDPAYYRSREKRLKWWSDYGIDGEVSDGYYVVTNANQIRRAISDVDPFSGVYDMKRPYVPPTIQELNVDLSEDLMANADNTKANEYGDKFGWSVESITNHLKEYIINSAGVPDILAKSHVKDINDKYGTNFGVYRKNGVRMLKRNTKPISELKLTENPNGNDGVMNKTIGSKFSQYKLDSRKEGFSELMRMLNDDPELYYEYLEYLGKDVESKC